MGDGIDWIQFAKNEVEAEAGSPVLPPDPLQASPESMKVYWKQGMAHEITCESQNL
jgi:hypothetical protein